MLIILLVICEISWIIFEHVLSEQLQRGTRMLEQWVLRGQWPRQRALLVQRPESPALPPRQGRPLPVRRPGRAPWASCRLRPRWPNCRHSPARVALTSAMKEGRLCFEPTTSKFLCLEDLYIIMMSIFNQINVLERYAIYCCYSSFVLNVDSNEVQSYKIMRYFTLNHEIYDSNNFKTYTNIMKRQTMKYLPFLFLGQ